MKFSIMISAVVSVFALSAVAQVQDNTNDMMEPMVQGAIVDGGVVTGDEDMSIDPDIMDNSPDFVPSTELPKLEQETPMTFGEKKTDEMIYGDADDNADIAEDVSTLPMDDDVDTAPKVMPED